MKNEWKESLAKKYIKEYQLKKVSKDLALRIYSTHLLGNNTELVLHGGGNTSVKVNRKNIFGEKVYQTYDIKPGKYKVKIELESGESFTDTIIVRDDPIKSN